jgi:tetratricopeptide (TPR) repeat protein
LEFVDFGSERNKLILLQIVALMSHLRIYDGIVDRVDKLISIYGGLLTANERDHLLLEKADFLSNKGMLNSSALLFKKIISSHDSDSSSKAYAYSGLARTTNKDVLENFAMASDYHLVSGNNFEAARNLVFIVDRTFKDSPERALQTIDKAINIYVESTNLLNKEFTASLKHKKAALLQILRDLPKAAVIIKDACELRRGLLGNQSELYSSLSLASYISSDMGDAELAKKYNDEAESISNHFDDELSYLSLEMSNYALSGKVIPKEIEVRVLNSDSDNLKEGLYIIKSGYKGLTLDERLVLLDKAVEFSGKENVGYHGGFVYFVIAETYREHELFPEAIENYKKSLELNPYDLTCNQNCGAILFKIKAWDEAVIFFEKAMDKLGQLPNVTYCYAKALYESGNYPQALKFFRKVKGKSTINQDLLSDLISSCLDRMDDENIDYVERVTIELDDKPVTLDDFKLAMDSFSKSISSDSRMHFFKLDKEKPKWKYKWIQNPEEESKHLLITFLNAYFGRSGVEILQESRAGAGFIDLYLMLRGGLKVIVELKLCGNGYSSTYAKSGEEQLEHYLENTDTKVGFLIVFDSRTRDFGKYLEPSQILNGCQIITTRIDLRTEVKKTNDKLQLN